MPHRRQSRLNSGPGFQTESLTPLKLLPFLSDAAGWWFGDTTPCRITGVRMTGVTLHGVVSPEVEVRALREQAAVERTWHTDNSQCQILATYKTVNARFWPHIRQSMPDSG